MKKVHFVDFICYLNDVCGMFDIRNQNSVLIPIKKFAPQSTLFKT